MSQLRCLVNITWIPSLTWILHNKTWVLTCFLSKMLNKDYNYLKHATECPWWIRNLCIASIATNIKASKFICKVWLCIIYAVGPNLSCCTSLAKTKWISNTAEENSPAEHFVYHRPFTQGLHNRTEAFSFAFPFQMHFSASVKGGGE